MKKLLIYVFTGCLLAFGSITVPLQHAPVAEAATVRYAEVTTAGLNFRVYPSTKSTIMTVLKKGTRVEVLDVVNKYWVKASYNGRTGYLSTRYLKEVFAPSSTSSNTSSHSTSSNTSAAPATTTQSSIADQVITTGQKYLGTKYEFGAKSGQTSSFDCSSFTQFVFKENGISLPRSSRSQAAVGTTVSSKSDLRKGDLIFFKTGGRSDGKIDHVAIYMGDGKIIHAIPKGGVQISSFSGFWTKTAVLAKRVIK